MKYFVTGATGFIGGRVARQLVAAGHRVVALVRARARAQQLLDAGIELSEGDLADRASLRAGMTGVDGVFHLAAWYRIGARSDQAARINVDGTRHVLELMRELRIPKGVYTSTLAVFSDTGGRIVDESYRYDGPHLSAYERTKWRAHYEVAVPLQREGLPLVIVQPGVNYGPGDTSQIGEVIDQYLERKLPMLPAGVAYSWAHVDDTARGHLQAMESGRPGESYIIAGPPHTLIEAFTMAEQITGIPAPRIHPSPAVMRALAKVAGALEKLLPVPEKYRAETLRVMAGVTYLGSSAKAERELGFTARPLVEGLRETLADGMRHIKA